MISPLTTQEQNVRKVVGKKLEDLSVFERIRRLQASLKAMGLQQKQDDGVNLSSHSAPPSHIRD